MKVFTYEQDGRRIELVCDSRDTRNGFAHDCVFLLNGREENRASCHYLNRTWELYEFQSVILEALGKARAFAEDRLISRFKDSRGYMRMNDKRYEEFAGWVALQDTPLKREWRLYDEARAHFENGR